MPMPVCDGGSGAFSRGFGFWPGGDRCDHSDDAAGAFYKSMTSYRDHRIWQDVYHVPSEAGLLYIKFTADAISEFLLLSFKEKDGG
jgi:hypothetical protein